jgi:NAD(P)-dependent dehydrogenase (short-subunit alcohol dehydrogenase family)
MARPGAVLAVAMDAGKLQDVQRLLDETLAAFGAVHLACFNAGVGGREGSSSVLDADITGWEWVEAVNKWGVLYGCKLFGRHMADAAIADGTEGHIVNTASLAGLVGGSMGAYSTSKHAVVAITEKLVEELQANGAFPAVGASVLCPGLVATNIFNAERYPKAEEASKPVTIDEKQAAAVIEMLTAADAASPEGGGVLSKEEVADIVFASIASQQLYILPHYELTERAVRARAEAILSMAVPPQAGGGGGPVQRAERAERAEAKARL